MIDYGQLAGRLAAAGDRWALMREIQAEWGVPSAGAEGVPAAEVAAAETRLGFTLPAALKAWYALPSNPYFLKPRLFWTHLNRPELLEVWPEDVVGPDALIVFQSEYQNCCEWAFRVRDAHLPDPPVLCGSTEGEAADWLPQNDTLTEHLLQLLLVRLIHFGPQYYAAQETLTPEMTARVAHHFPDLGLPPWREYGDGCRLRGGPDVLLLVNARPPFAYPEHALYLGARSYAGLERATAQLGVDWDTAEEFEAQPGQGEPLG